MFLPQFQDAIDMKLYLPDLHTGTWEKHTRMPSEFMMSLNEERFVYGYRAGLGCPMPMSSRYGTGTSD